MSHNCETKVPQDKAIPITGDLEKKYPYWVEADNTKGYKRNSEDWYNLASGRTADKYGIS